MLKELLCNLVIFFIKVNLSFKCFVVFEGFFVKNLFVILDKFFVGIFLLLLENFII